MSRQFVKACQKLRVAAANALMWTKISCPPWVGSMKPNLRSLLQDLGVPVDCMGRGDYRA